MHPNWTRVHGRTATAAGQSGLTGPGCTEGRPPLRARTDQPDPGGAKDVSPPRAGRDRARGPNILIDPHRAFWHTSACEVECCDFRSLHLTYLLDVCLFDDDLPIANLEPGVSGRNSLPLSAAWAHASPRASRFWAPVDFCIEFYIDFRVDF